VGQKDGQSSLAALGHQQCLRTYCLRRWSATLAWWAEHRSLRSPLWQVV